MIQKPWAKHLFPKLCVTNVIKGCEKYHYHSLNRIYKGGGECFLKYLSDNFILTRGGRFIELERPAGANGYYYLIQINCYNWHIKIVFSMEQCDSSMPDKGRLCLRYHLYRDFDKLNEINTRYIYVPENELSYTLITEIIDEIYYVHRELEILDLEHPKVKNLLEKTGNRGRKPLGLTESQEVNINI